MVSDAWRTLSDDGQEEPVDDVFQVEQRGVGEHQEDYVGGESELAEQLFPVVHRIVPFVVVEHRKVHRVAEGAQAGDALVHVGHRHQNHCECKEENVDDGLAVRPSLPRT